MKKCLVMLVTLTMVACGSLCRADDVTINVRGHVVALPCRVATTDTTADLGDLFTFDLVAPGAAGPWRSISLQLVECPDMTSQVTAAFSGTADDGGFYRNDGTAQNVQIELTDAHGAPLNDGSTSRVQIDASQGAVFDMKVRAISVRGRASQGSIQSVINVTYTYA